MQNEFAYIIVTGYAICVLCAIYKMYVRMSPGWLFMCAFFLTLVHRNYKVFLVSHIHFTDDVMIGNYIGCACCLMGMIILAFRAYGQP